MAGIEDSRQNDERRQGQEIVPDWERIVKIMRVEARGSSIDKAHRHVLCRIVGMLVVIVDPVGVSMIAAMIMRVAVHMTTRGRRRRMRRMCLVG